LVAASVGPYGAFLTGGQEYKGDYAKTMTEEDLMNWHRKRFALLANSNADILACETIPCSLEARALVRLAQEFPSTKIWLSFSCKDDVSISDGELLSDTIKSIADLDTNSQVMAVGINCSAPQHVLPLIKSVATPN
jgi:homocysteine S-methyltransferase